MAPSAAFGGTIETLDVAIETLSHQVASATATDDQATLQRDVDQERSAAASRAVAGLKLSAVKLAVLAGGSALEPVVLSSMLKELSGSALGLSAACAACVDGSTSAVTQPLRKTVVNHATGALKAVKALVNVVKEETIRGRGSPRNDQAVTRAAAEVVGACDTLSRSAWSNKTAIGRCFARSARSIDDARRELAAGIKEDASATEKLELEEEEDIEVEELTAAEFKVASAVLATLESVTSFLRQALRTLQSSSSDETDWQAWENAEFHVQSLAQMLDELAAAVYPPQDPESLAACADAVGNGLQLLQEEARADWGWAEALERILNTIGSVCEEAKG